MIETYRDMRTEKHRGIHIEIQRVQRYREGYSEIQIGIQRDTKRYREIHKDTKRYREIQIY